MMNRCRTCLKQLSSEAGLRTEEPCIDEMDVSQAIREFASLQDLYADNLPPYICTHCFKLLRTALVFRRMVLKSHAQLTEKIVSSQSENRVYIEVTCDSLCDPSESGGDEAPDQTTFKVKPKRVLLRPCPFCGVKLKGKKNYSLHIKKHNINGSLDYACAVCPKKFSKKEYLLVHTRTHTGEKPYYCDICNKHFSQLATYYVHKRRLHDKIVQGTCNYCGKVFVDKPELDVHIKMWHTGERPYLCEFCSATFVCNRTLQRHRKEIHSEKKPCQKCGKMLGDYALKKHLIRHQVIEEGLKIVRKKYTCEYCKIVMNFTSRRRHLEKQHGIKLHGRGNECTKVPINNLSGES